MEIFGETIDRELPDLAEQGVRIALHRPARPRARRAAAADGASSRTGRRPQRRGSTSGSRSTTAAAPSSSRRRGGSPRAGSTRTRSTRTSFAAPPVRAGDARPRPHHPHLGRAARLELPALAVAYAEFVFADTLWPDFGARRPSRRARGVRAAAPPIRRHDEQLVMLSRLARRARRPAARARPRLARRLVAVRARRSSRRSSRARVLAMARPLRPLAPAVYVGVVLALVGAQIGGLVWMLGGLPRDVRARLRLQARLAKTRAPATVADRRDRARRGLDRLRARASCCSCATSTYTGGSRRSPCCSPCGRPTRSRTSAAACSAGTSWRRRSRPGKTWEGFVIGSAATASSSPSSRSTTPAHVPGDLAGARARRRGRARRAARRPVRVDAQARHAR